MRQLSLFHEAPQREFGGSLLKGIRKCMRPLDRGKPQHLVLKATNSFLLLENQELVKSTIRRFALKFGIKIYSLAVHDDHVHLALTFQDRVQYTRWIRATTSVLTQKIPNLKWKFRPYSRVTSWGRGYHRLKNYISKNQIEGQFIAQARASVEDFRAACERDYSNLLQS